MYLQSNSQKKMFWKSISSLLFFEEAKRLICRNQTGQNPKQTAFEEDCTETKARLTDKAD